MKAILEFDLPDERSEFMWAVHGGKYSSVLLDFDKALRAAVEHESEGEEKIEGADWARRKMWELLNEAGLDPICE